MLHLRDQKKISEIKFFAIPSEELTFWFSLFPSSFQDKHSFPGSVCACLGIILGEKMDVSQPTFNDSCM